MINQCQIRIWSGGRTLLDTLEAPVIALGGGKDSNPWVAQSIERNNVRVANGRHGI